ncbi:hypothetical protein BY458DRAFT_523046 [Sporodiniella umbellata]|nr:hypothetical protein BY458DRAFT_523046 [Sporodiniella umbellata]
MYNPTSQEADIYALLSDNDPIIHDPAAMDNANLMGMFSSHTNYALSNDFNQDFLSFDMTSQHYTPSDPYSLQRRRHSTAVQLMPPQSMPSAWSAMDHRSSLPNIFQPPNPDRFGPLSVKREPAIEFNPLPWSTETTTVRRKRSLSEQLDPGHLAPPMSGIASRRVSMATPSDIHAWQKMVQPKEDELKQVKEEEDEETPEDYPHITEADVEAAKTNPSAIPRRQKLRYEGDEYTPKWVRYTGQSKEGYCDTCPSGKWLQLKNSAYWYHKQFFHGISSVSGKRFQNPIEQRQGKQDALEGLCHQCKEFVPVCNSKRKNSVLWYRHAHKCHIYDRPKPRNMLRKDVYQEQLPIKRPKYI